MFAYAIISFHVSKDIFLLSSNAETCLNTPPTNESPAPVESTWVIFIEGIIVLSSPLLINVPLEPNVIATVLAPISCSFLTPSSTVFSFVIRITSSSLSLIKSALSIKYFESFINPSNNLQLLMHLYSLDQMKQIYYFL